jgi:hypothetical protein
MNEGQRITVHISFDETGRPIDEAMIHPGCKESLKRAFLARISEVWREAGATL